LVVAAAVLLIAAILWSARAILSPFVGGGLLLILLWPWRARPLVRQLLFAVGTLIAISLLVRARVIVYPAVTALLVAFLLNPLVDRLTARRVPRSLAALVVLLPVGGFLLLFALGVLPVLLEQARALIAGLPGAYASVVERIGPWLSNQLPAGTVRLPPDFASMLPSAERILKGLGSGLVQVGHGLAAVAQVGSFFLLTPILTYYLLVDINRLIAGMRPYFPPAAVENAWRLKTIFQETVSAWLKAQLLVAAIVGSLSIVGFLIIGLPYALLLGFLVGMLNLVPVLGFWVSAILALSAGLFTPAPLAMLAKTALVLFAVQMLEQNLLSPKIVGRRLGTKPVVLLLVMLTLGIFVGIAGVLLAAPVIGLVRGAWTLWGPRPRDAAGSPDPA
jgi:predicted PurR-regulated permease PerM